MKLIAALFAATLLLAGCAGSGSADGPGVGTNPESSAATPSSEAKGTPVEIVIKDGKVTPQGKRVEVKVGDPITLHITSDADEELHVHSDPEHEYAIAPGDDKTFTFTLKVPGQVAVEAHHLDVTILQLVARS